MNARQQRFCDEYLICLDATAAAIKVGYSAKTAHSIGHENLNKPELKKYIESKQDKLSEKLQLTQEWCLNRFKEISDRCMQAEPLMINIGKEKVQATDDDGNLLFIFDSAGANKATEQIGKMLGYYIKDNEQKKPEQPSYFEIGGKRIYF